MAVLSTKDRKRLKTSTFGLPKERKYPMPDRSHAANAKARASQQLKKGNLTLAEKRRIDRKADKILGEGKMKDEKGKKKNSKKSTKDYQSHYKDLKYKHKRSTKTYRSHYKDKDDDDNTLRYMKSK